jgi:hypothetical protein
MIIKDLHGDRYELSKTRLSELPKRWLSRYVILKEFTSFDICADVPVRYTGNSKPDEPTHLSNYGQNYVGCRPFSPTNYKRIVKAAKEAK